MKNSIVINIIGAPCSGKTTFAYELMSDMKKSHIEVEFSAEFAKELIYANRLDELKIQEYVFGEQVRRLQNLYGKVKYIITDSPLILSTIYGDTTDSFKEAVIRKFEEYNNIIIKLNPFSKEMHQLYGRMHNHEDSLLIDKQIMDVIHKRYAYHIIEKRNVNIITSAIASGTILVNSSNK